MGNIGDFMFWGENQLRFARILEKHSQGLFYGYLSDNGKIKYIADPFAILPTHYAEISPTSSDRIIVCGDKSFIYLNWEEASVSFFGSGVFEIYFEGKLYLGVGTACPQAFRGVEGRRSYFFFTEIKTNTLFALKQDLITRK